MDKKISELNITSEFTGEELIPIVQNKENKAISISTLIKDLATKEEINRLIEEINLVLNKINGE